MAPALADANHVYADWNTRTAILQFPTEHGDQTVLPLRLAEVEERGSTAARVCGALLSYPDGLAAMPCLPPFAPLGGP